MVPNTDPDAGLTGVLGIEFVESGEGYLVATMPITEKHLQPMGFLHGGASVALAETVASYGAFLSLKPGQGVFGLEINANHLRPKRSGSLRAEGKALHVGKRSQVWQIHITDEKNQLICVSRCTLAIVQLNDT